MVEMMGKGLEGYLALERVEDLVRWMEVNLVRSTEVLKVPKMEEDLVTMTALNLVHSKESWKAPKMEKDWAQMTALNSASLKALMKVHQTGYRTAYLY